MLNYLRDRGDAIAPYFATLYFVEIIYFMYLLLFMFGRTVSVAAGFTAAALLTLHIIRLYRLRDIHRVIQLFLMDLHFAFSAAFVFNRLAVSGIPSAGDFAMTIFRAVTAAAELILIFALTDLSVLKKYCRD